MEVLGIIGEDARSTSSWMGTKKGPLRNELSLGMGSSTLLFSDDNLPPGLFLRLEELVSLLRLFLVLPRDGDGSSFRLLWATAEA